MSLVSVRGSSTGIPYDADLVFDAALPAQSALRGGRFALDGRDREVTDWLFAHPGEPGAAGRLEDLVRFPPAPLSARGQGLSHHRARLHRRQHRSVAFVESLRAFLEGLGFAPLVRHRDLGPE